MIQMLSGLLVQQCGNHHGGDKPEGWSSQEICLCIEVTSKYYLYGSNSSLKYTIMASYVE